MELSAAGQHDDHARADPARPVQTFCAIYCRISKDSDQRGLGVARQEKECRALAERLGYKVMEVYVDNDLSASSLRKARPRYQDMLLRVREGRVAAIIARHDDRLHRHPMELEHFIEFVEETGVKVHLLDGFRDFTTARGRADARAEVARSKYESERKGERLQLMHEDKARDGQWKGGPRPYGYDVPHLGGVAIKGTGKLLVIDEEAAVIREASRRVLAGESVYRVCGDLNRRGIATAQGAQWRTQTLRRVLTNPTTAGKREYKGEIVGQASWEPILDCSAWERLRAILQDPARTRKRPARAYLLTGGIARCGRCTSPLHAQRRQSGKRAYACLVMKGGCGKLTIHADPFEALVIETVIAAVESPKFLQVVSEHGSENDEAVSIAADEAKLLELADYWDAGRISRPEWMRLRDQVQGRLHAARQRQSRRARTTAVDIYMGREGALRAVWKKLTLDQQRTVVFSVLERVIVSPATRRGPVFDPSRIDPETGFVWRF